MSKKEGTAWIEYMYSDEYKEKRLVAVGSSSSVSKLYVTMKRDDDERERNEG